MVVSPIHTGIIRGKPVRFFRSPADEPDLPWHAVQDLQLALSVPRSVRRTFAQGLHKKFAGETRTVDTEKDIAIIGPHYMAQGLISGLIDTGRAGNDLDLEYVRAMGEAVEVLTADLPDDEARLNFMVAAGYRHIHGKAPETPPNLKVAYFDPKTGRLV